MWCVVGWLSICSKVLLLPLGVGNGPNGMCLNQNPPPALHTFPHNHTQPADTLPKYIQVCETNSTKWQTYPLFKDPQITTRHTYRAFMGTTPDAQDSKTCETTPWPLTIVVAIGNRFPRVNVLGPCCTMDRAALPMDHMDKQRNLD